MLRGQLTRRRESAERDVAQALDGTHVFDEFQTAARRHMQVANDHCRSYPLERSDRVRDALRRARARGPGGRRRDASGTGGNQ